MGETGSKLSGWAGISNQKINQRGSIDVAGGGGAISQAIDGAAVQERRAPLGVRMANRRGERGRARARNREGRLGRIVRVAQRIQIKTAGSGAVDDVEVEIAVAIGVEPQRHEIEFIGAESARTPVSLLHPRNRGLRDYGRDD